MLSENNVFYQVYIPFNNVNLFIFLCAEEGPAESKGDVVRRGQTYPNDGNPHNEQRLQNSYYPMPQVKSAYGRPQSHNAPPMNNGRYKRGIFSKYDLISIPKNNWYGDPGVGISF